MKTQELVKQLRAALGGLTQEKLARAMSVTLRTIARYEDQSEGPGLEGLVHLYSMARHHGFTDLADEFRKAALRTSALQQEAELQRLAKRIDETDSPETLAFVRQHVVDIYDKCVEADPEGSRDELFDIIDEIKSKVERIGDRIFVDGVDGMIKGTNQ